MCNQQKRSKTSNAEYLDEIQDYLIDSLSVVDQNGGNPSFLRSEQFNQMIGEGASGTFPENLRIKQALKKLDRVFQGLDWFGIESFETGMECKLFFETDDWASVKYP